MSTLNTQGISLYYELHGDRANPPVLLLSGLGGVGASWGPQVERFARNYYVILPDQRGTGRTTHAPDGYTTQQLAADMASLVEHLDLGSVHVVGASTGGAIAQYMALNHRETVRSLTLSSSFARFDPFMQREFEVRRKVAEQLDPLTIYSCYSLFLFSPRYTYEHPEKVKEWIDRAMARGGDPQDKAVGLKRIDMIAAHDTLSQLSTIELPTLVICGEQNHCTPMPNSEELAHAIRGAKLVVFRDAGELIELEREVEYCKTVSDFIDGQGSP